MLQVSRIRMDSKLTLVMIAHAVHKRISKEKSFRSKWLDILFT